MVGTYLGYPKAIRGKQPREEACLGDFCADAWGRGVTLEVDMEY